MSTIIYSSLSSQREKAPPPGAAGLKSQPGVSNYLDMVAALVPAEVLSLHAVIISFTTEQLESESGAGADVSAATIITDPGVLKASFLGLVVLSVVLYLMPRLTSKVKTPLNLLDIGRSFIPPFAFVAWTMLQPITAFDAVFPDAVGAGRTVGALFLAVALGIAAGALAKVAENRPPPEAPRLPAGPKPGTS